MPTSPYPGALDDASTLYTPADSFSGKPLTATLAVLCLNTDTTLQLSAAVVSAIGGPAAWGVVSIGDEQIVYAAASGANLTGCIRGAFGTTAVGHAAGVSVRWRYVAAFDEALQAAVVAIEQTLGVTGAFQFVEQDAVTTTVGDPGDDDHVPTEAAVRTAIEAHGGTPGGSDTQVQFNDGGSFGGDSGLTYDKVRKWLGVGSAVPEAPIDVVGPSNVTNQIYLTDTLPYSSFPSGALGFRGESAPGVISRFAVFFGGKENTTSGDTKGTFGVFVYNGSTFILAMRVASTGAVTFIGNVICSGLTVGTLSGLLKAASGVVSAATAGADYAVATNGTNGQALTSNGAGGFGTPVSALPPNGAAGGDLNGTYPNPGVVKINGTALSGLATGLLKNTTTTGVPNIAVAGTDYASPTNGTTGQLLTSNGSGLWGTALTKVTSINATPSSASDGSIPTEKAVSQRFADVVGGTTGKVAVFTSGSAVGDGYGVDTAFLAPDTGTNIDLPTTKAVVDRIANDLLGYYTQAEIDAFFANYYTKAEVDALIASNPGPTGPTGPEGPEGPEGPQGPQGEPGVCPDCP